MICMDPIGFLVNSVFSSALFPGRLRTAIINLWGADVRGGSYLIFILSRLDSSWVLDRL